MAQQPPEGPRSNSTMIFVLGGLVVLALAFGIFYARGNNDPAALEPAAGFSQTGMVNDGDGVNNEAAPILNNNGNAPQNGAPAQPPQP